MLHLLAGGVGEGGRKEGEREGKKESRNALHTDAHAGSLAEGDEHAVSDRCGIEPAL